MSPRIASRRRVVGRLLLLPWCGKWITSKKVSSYLRRVGQGKLQQFFCSECPTG